MPQQLRQLKCSSTAQSSNLDKWAETRQNRIYIAPLNVRGAGLRWRPLHESAEAPTEPGGETLLSEAKNRLNIKFNLFLFVRRYLRSSHRRPTFPAGKIAPQESRCPEMLCKGPALSSCTLCQGCKNRMQGLSFAHLFPSG